MIGLWRCRNNRSDNAICRSAVLPCWSWRTIPRRTSSCNCRKRSGLRHLKSASMTSRVRSCGNTPTGPVSMNDKLRSQSKSSRPSLIMSASASRSSVVTRRCAHTSSARRCSGVGTSSSSRRTSAWITSGWRTVKRSGCSRYRSVSSDSASGLPCVKPRASACSGSGTPRLVR
jgi:hypothetical protein